MRRDGLIPLAGSAAALVVVAFLLVTLVAHELDSLRDPATLLALAVSLLLCALIPLIFRRGVRKVLEERTSSIREDNQRLQSQSHALFRLANSKIIFSGDILSAVRELTELAAVTLRVERTGVWQFDSNQRSIKCVCQYEYGPRRFTSGMEIQATDAPRYFSAIRNQRVLVADDVLANPLTNEFSFLAEIGVTSMLDAPIFVNGELFGIVCHEHVGPKRHWTTDEQNFASSIADMVAMAYEVHERRRVEGELRRKSRAIEASLEGIAIIERDESFSFVNPSFARMFAYDSSHELVGKSWRALYDAAQIKKLERHIFVSFLRAGNLQCEALGLRKDGSTFAQELSLTALGDGGLVCLVRDITQRKEAEQHLHESRRFLRKVIDTDPNFIFVKDFEGRFVLVNQAVAEAYGTSVEQLIGRTDADFNANAEEVARFKADDQYVISSGKELLVTEEVVTDASKKCRVVQTVKRPLRIPGREEVHVLGVSTDITQRKKLSEQLVQAQKMEALGQLAGGIAHDFNNLMTGVLGYTTLIKLEASEQPEIYRSADVIEQAATRASELTQKLLGFARKGKHQNTPVDIHRTVDETLAIIKRTIHPRISVATDLSAPNPYVLGDPVQLQQIILNLAINARDAMDPELGGSDGGTISVETSQVMRSQPGAEGELALPDEPREHIKILVRDTGCGIDSDKKEKVFEPFYTTKTEGRGSGMGLAMVYGIVSNHGGQIFLESERGKGTTFTIVLPSTTLPLSSRVEREVSVPARGRGRILVVDDHDVVRSATSDMLQTLGYEVITAKDGVDAVEKYRKESQNIDLVILDFVMPNMSARECLDQLKAINPGVRAVLSTGYVNNLAVQELLKSDGMMGYLQKPFVLANLSKVVSSALAPSKEAWASGASHAVLAANGPGSRRADAPPQGKKAE